MSEIIYILMIMAIPIWFIIYIRTRLKDRRSIGASIFRATYYVLSILAVVGLGVYIPGIFNKPILFAGMLFVPIILGYILEGKIFPEEEMDEDRRHKGVDNNMNSRENAYIHKQIDYREKNKMEFEARKIEEKRRFELLSAISSEEVEKLVKIININTKRKVISISPKLSDELPLFTSKYGGIPYVPRGMEPPRDSQGRMLRLLAQFNLEELPDIEQLPALGILQFWCINDGNLGCNVHTANENGTYRVIYYEELDKSVKKDEIVSIYKPWLADNGVDCFPIKSEHSLDFSLREEGIHPEDSRWCDMMVELWNKKYPHMNIEEFEEIPNAFEPGEYQEMYCDDKISGYPNYVQMDRPFDTYFVLLEMTSSGYKDSGIMWGDSGIAHFFITEEALAAKRFEEAEYTWSCC